MVVNDSVVCCLELACCGRVFASRKSPRLGRREVTCATTFPAMHWAVVAVMRRLALRYHRLMPKHRQPLPCLRPVLF